MNRGQRRRKQPRLDAEELERRVTNAMAEIMDLTLGAGRWSYDASEDVWIAPDEKHKGPGRGFIIVRRGGAGFKTVLPDTAVS